MPKLLISEAVKHYKAKGDTAITKNFLYQGCRSGSIPHCKIGSRFVIDTSELDKYMQESICESIAQSEAPEVIQYGQLRKVQG